MSVVRVCDCCGAKDSEPEPGAILPVDNPRIVPLVFRPSWSVALGHDLCPRCAEKVRLFMNDLHCDNTKCP